MKISCVIPLYNAEKYIGKALDSILAQSYPIDEILVIDDCSTDHSLSVVEEYSLKNKNIKLIKQSSNKGASAARNLGILNCTGDWILFMDADDLCTHNIVEEYVNFITNDDIQMVYSQFIQIDEKGDYISSPMKGQTLNGVDGFCKMFLRNPVISPSGIIVKKEALLQLNNFDESIKYVEDVDLWLRLLLNEYTIAYLDLPGSLIRRHTANTTNSIEITNIGERTLLNKFGLELIKEKIYSRDKEKNELHLEFIDILIRFNKVDEACKLIYKIDLNETASMYSQYIFTKAILNIYQNNLEEARLIFEQSLRNCPMNGAVLNNLGVIYAKVGLKEKAVAYFRKALNIHEGYLDAQHNLKVVDHSKVDYKFTYRLLRKNLLKYS